MNDDCFNALANELRRALLVNLLHQSPFRVSMSSHDDRAGGPTASNRRERMQLWHLHLPKLEDYGFIRWDREAGVVERGPRFDEIRPLLEFLERYSDSL